jgi:hypothetical protein
MGFLQPIVSYLDGIIHAFSELICPVLLHTPVEIIPGEFENEGAWRFLEDAVVNWHFL